VSVELNDAVVVVTGASGGLGTALSYELARQGARLALVARGAGRLASLAEEIDADGSAAIAIPADITDRDDRLGIIEETRRHLGPIDVLVNNAGIGRATAFVDEDPIRIIEVNLLGPLALTRNVVRDMLDRGRGHVLTVASLGALGLPSLVAYSASKAGLVAFSTALAEELRGTGVSTTAVNPGFIVDRGMYVPYGTPAPWYLGSNHTSVIAKKAIAAMQDRRPVVTLNRMPVLPLRVLQTVSESAFRAATRALGLRAHLARLAEKQLDYDGRPLDRRDYASRRSSKRPRATVGLRISDGPGAPPSFPVISDPGSDGRSCDSSS
jgi:short-subunit dehydrogenase